mmetsp:Transcript_90196/g.232838  ORF Transcript_90196/g.232838 Transcript_90196/m.232838 type:complete len:639 (+) Transcript_90196:109-2025(+)
MSPTAVADPVFEALGMQPVEMMGGAGQSPLAGGSPQMAAGGARPGYAFGNLSSNMAFPQYGSWPPPAWSMYAQAAAAAAAAANSPPISPTAMSLGRGSPQSAPQGWASPAASAVAGAGSPGNPGSSGVGSGAAGPLLLPDVLPAAGDSTQSPVAMPADGRSSGDARPAAESEAPVPPGPVPPGPVLPVEPALAAAEAAAHSDAGAEGAPKAQQPSGPPPLPPLGAPLGAGLPQANWGGAMPSAAVPPAAAAAFWFAQMSAMVAAVQQQQAASAAAMAMQQQQPPTESTPQRSPLATTPGGAHGASTPVAEKEEKVELNLAERTAGLTPIADEKQPRKERVGTPVSLMLATPPPRSANTLRADAQCFVPGSFSSETPAPATMTPSPPMRPSLPLTGCGGMPMCDMTPVKACLMKSLDLTEVEPNEALDEVRPMGPADFVEMRTKMLRLRHGLEKAEKVGLPLSTPAFKLSMAARPSYRDDYDSEGSTEADLPVLVAPAVWTKGEGASAGSMLLSMVKGDADAGKRTREANKTRAGASVMQLLRPAAAPAAKGKGEGKGRAEGPVDSRSKIRAEIRASAAAAREAATATVHNSEEQACADASNEETESPPNQSASGRRRHRRGGGGSGAAARAKVGRGQS